MNYEQRILLRQAISAIQLPKELRARRMWVKTVTGEKLYLGGSHLPQEQQVRSGYPIHHLPDNDW